MAGLTLGTRSHMGNVPSTASEDQSAALPRISVRTQGLNLFLTGFLVLFMELASIRWFAANVIFLQFFTNVVLLASFLRYVLRFLARRRPALASIGRLFVPDQLRPEMQERQMQLFEAQPSQ